MQILEFKLGKMIKSVGIFAIVAIIVGGIGVQKMKFNSTIHTLNTMDSATIISFKIYPTAGQSGDPFIEFEPSDPIVEAFLKSVIDFRSSTISAGSVATPDHGWSMEILTETDEVQMGCYIPVAHTQIVLGQFGKFGPTSAIYYGQFQSQLLYQWYQEYSYRWLNHDESNQPQDASNE